MTSEAPHRPGQEPGEVSPGAGGPAPYGDRPAQQDNGYPGAPDLGWAPPPPAGGGSAPAWAAQDEPANGWTPANRGAAQVPPPAESGGWDRAGQPGWGAPEQNPPAWTAGPSNPAEPGPPAWGNPAEPAAPAWGAASAPGQGEQPAWAQSAEPNRAAAHVPAPATTPEESWNVPAGQQQDDASRSGGWPAPQQDDESARSGGWPGASEPQPDRSGGWSVGTAAPQQHEPPAWGQQDQAAPAWAPTEPPARASAKVPVPGAPTENARATPPADPGQSGGWPAGPSDGHQDDPDGSGGWAAGRAAGQPDPAQPGWDTSDEQRPSWTGAAAVSQQQRDQDPPAQPGWTPAERPEAAPWSPPETPARASASVPSPDSPPSWAGNQDEPAQWNPPQPPAIPAAQPWAASEAWGRAAEAEPAESPANEWQPNRGAEAPAYQPAPGPGISPANAVPLPPQEQRVPGAALAAAPPADYVPPAQYSPAAEAAEREPQGYEPERAGNWGETSHEKPQSPAGPVVPAPRTSPESGTPGHVSASASVPLASRVMPPTDQSLRPAATPAPQPRVYGRPVPPEPEEAPGHDAPSGYPGEAARFDEPGPRAGEPEHPATPSGYAEAAPAPSSPAGPPPFPPGVPSFMDPAANNRPVNGVHPQEGDRANDPFGGPGGQREPYGSPVGHDPFAHQGQYGGPGGQPEQYGSPAGGRASVAVPGQGPGGPGQGGFPPTFPPSPQQAPPAWQPGPTSDPEQGRFDSFKPEAEPKTEAPAPKVRNGRVLALVLIAAVLILAIPLGLLTLLGKIGGDDKPAPFDPAVGSCVKQSGNGATAAQCAEPGAFSVVAKVDSKEKCADPAQPHVVLPGDGPNRVLCLKPAAK